MNTNAANDEADSAQVPVENVDLSNDVISWAMKSLIVMALVLVSSVGLAAPCGTVACPFSGGQAERRRHQNPGGSPGGVGRDRLSPGRQL